MSEPVTCICKEQPAYTQGEWIPLVSQYREGGFVVVRGLDRPIALVLQNAGDVPLIAAAPDLLAFARRALPRLIAERASVYEGCSVPATGEVPDEDDREVIAMIDREIDELRALIARAEGTA